ncbi:MAG: DUF92 domain-containing protein [Armatimonadetes bacterium]|nr:DUF92 domain-containing protein [Armatimonadota bacterium]
MMPMLFAAAAGVVCWTLGLLTRGGSIVAAIVGAAAWEAGRWAWAAPLLIFFVTSALLSRMGGRRAQTEGGPRNAKQVISNGGPAAVCAVLYTFGPQPALSAAFLASLCAANADTWATELGTRLGRKPYRISNLEPAEGGRSGVVSNLGLLGAFVGSAAVASAAPLLDLTAMLPVITVIGFAACLLDSLLGDLAQAVYTDEGGRLHERPIGKLTRGWRAIDNDAVNLLSAAAAAFAGYLLAA